MFEEARVERERNKELKKKLVSTYWLEYFVRISVYLSNSNKLRLYTFEYNDVCIAVGLSCNCICSGNIGVPWQTAIMGLHL